MTCTYDREQLALYVNKDATTEEHRATDEHLGGCAECRGIVAQYQSMAGQLSGTLTYVLPVRLSMPRPAYHSWRAVAAAAAVVLALWSVMQVPTVAAQVARAFPFLQVFELDKSGVASFIRGFSLDKGGKVYRPDQYQSLEEAQLAWGGYIPQPTALPEHMELYLIELYRGEADHKDVYLRYRNTQVADNLTIHLSTGPQQRKVPNGATSETIVNGQKAVVISGTWSRYPGKPLQWEPDSDVHLFFPLGALYGEVYKAGQQPVTTVSQLVTVAESIR